MNKLTKIFAVTILTFAGFQAYAQDTNTDAHDITIKIPEVAILDIEPANNSITLAPEAPTEAGNFLDFTNASDKSLWLNYSSVIGSKSDPSRKVTVAITNGKVPGGLKLSVVAAAINTGKGTLGTPSGTVVLNERAQDLITGIGSGYTENGENFGHNLTYKLDLAGDNKDVSEVDFDDSTTITVTYTLTDN